MSKKLSINEVIQKTGMSANPGHYDGRPIGLGDVTAEKILAISDGIKKHIGEKEAEVFNQMVMDLPTLKPSFFFSFAQRLYQGADEKGWWWNKGQWLSHYSRPGLNLLTMPRCEETERIKESYKKLLNK